MSGDWLRSLAPWDDGFVVLRHAPCGPDRVSRPHRHRATPMAPFVELAPVALQLRESPATEGATNRDGTGTANERRADAVVILRPGARGSSSEPGFAPYAEWVNHAFQVLRDAVLQEVIALGESKELRVRRTPADQGHTLPCDVGEMPPPSAPSAALLPASPRPRRRR